MLLKFRISVLVVFVFSVFCVSGQKFDFESIVNKIALPSNECYRVVQSQDGYIFVSTESGLYSYNGRQSKLLLKAPCYSSFTDKNGVLHFISNSNEIYTCNDDTVLKSIRYCDMLKPFKNKLSIVYQTTRLDSGLLFNAQTESVFYSYVKCKSYLVPRKEESGYVDFYYSNTNLYYLNDLSPLTRKSIRKSKTLKIRIRKDNKTIFIEHPYFRNIDSDWRVLYGSVNDISYFAIGNVLVKLKQDGTYENITLPDIVISLYIDKDANAWIGTIKNGVFVFGNSLYDRNHSLDGISVTGIFEDYERGIWCSTLEKGLFYLNNKHIVTYNSLNTVNGKCDLLKKVNNSIFASSKGGELLQIDRTNYKVIQFPELSNYILKDVIAFNSGYLISGNDFVVATDNKFRITRNFKYDLTLLNTGATAICNFQKGIATSHFTGLKIMANSYFKLVHSLNNPNDIVFSNGFIYVAEKDGVRKFDTSNYHATKIKVDKMVFKKLLKSSSGHLYALSTNQGIYSIQGNDSVKHTGIISKAISYYHDFTEDASGNIWLATNHGVFQLNGDLKVLRHYTVNNGLPSNEIGKVAAGNGKLFYSTIEGLGCITDGDAIKNFRPPLIRLKTKMLNNKPIETHSSYLRLPSNQFSLKFEFDVLTYKSKANDPLMFFTICNTNTFDVIKDYKQGNQLVFDNLIPGKYLINVYGINNDGILSLHPVVITLDVPPPYWQNIWFMVLVIFSASAIFIFISFIIIKRIKSREEEKTRINKIISEYKLAALQSHMNPHFISNSINSIQNFILQKKEREAYTYLSKFSKLIRSILHNSIKKNVRLREEIELIEMYIEMEQLRFDNKFAFELSISEAIDDNEILIPSMLIQPYIENAIWHGLMHLDNARQGLIIVSITTEYSLLKISIEDNGIGRKRAAMFKRAHHIPVAMDINKKRLDTIHSVMKNDIASINIKDLYDNRGNATGTRVDIYLPVEML